MPRIIALQACRHGAGCSHLAANLAVLLMQKGKRVGLLDTDPRGGGLRTLFGLEETLERRLDCYWWFDPAPKVEKGLRRALYSHTDDVPDAAGIYLAPLGSRLGVNSQQLRYLQRRYRVATAEAALQSLSQDLKLDYLLIDTQPELNDDSLLALALADMILLLMQLDTYDFQRAAVLLEVMHRLSVPQIWLVPSKVLPALTPEVVQQKLQETYNQKVAGILYLSEDMVRLASNGLFCLHHPDHPLTQVMAAIAERLELPNVPPVSRTLPVSAGRLGRSRAHSLFNILDLPDLQRKLLTDIIRRGTSTLQDLVVHHNTSAEEITAALHQLLEAGWLVQDPGSASETYYRTAFLAEVPSSPQPPP